MTHPARLMLRLATLGMLGLVAGCHREPPQMLGTLEYDRITLPAPAAERIVDIAVREGQQVQAGARVMTLQQAQGEALLDAARASAQRARDSLQELRNGARREDVTRARAQLDAARAQARDSRAYYRRLQPLGQRRLVAAADVDRARAAADNADAQVHAAQASLDELVNGVRPEQIAQAWAALASAEAAVRAQQAVTAKLDVVAPRTGRIDSLPYRLGDQAPVGAALAVMLVGEQPYARVYVPEALRAQVKVGGRVRVQVGAEGGRSYQGRVRMVRNDPVFTPYYALAGDDASRLSYLAELQLEDAAALPAGLPLRAELDDAR